MRLPRPRIASGLPHRVRTGYGAGASYRLAPLPKTLAGFEPATSTLTGWHSKPTELQPHHLHTIIQSRPTRVE